MFDDFIRFVRELFSTNDFIPLHAPIFIGNEKQYLTNAIESTFVSSVGNFVSEFEHKVSEYTGIKYAIATVNGTSALHVALKIIGANHGTEVITQSLTFVATCNAIHYCGAAPVFVDVDKLTLSMSSKSLKFFLEQYCELREDGFCWNKLSNNRVIACLPVHTFGIPAELDKIKSICDKYNIKLVEDAAESLGSLYKGKHTGGIGTISAFSFNGNKIITTGGGGMILTNNKDLAMRAKHITTTAKSSSDWSFAHDEIGYNYRMPNINAALGVAQMEVLQQYVASKRELALKYQSWGHDNNLEFVIEPDKTRSNYWLNTIIAQDQSHRDMMLKATNQNKIMTRPVWTPMHKLSINKECQRVDMKNTEWLSHRIINVPSGVIRNNIKNKV